MCCCEIFVERVSFIWEILMLMMAFLLVASGYFECICMYASEANAYMQICNGVLLKKKNPAGYWCKIHHHLLNKRDVLKLNRKTNSHTHTQYCSMFRNIDVWNAAQLHINMYVAKSFKVKGNMLSETIVSLPCNIVLIFPINSMQLPHLERHLIFVSFSLIFQSKNRCYAKSSIAICSTHPSTYISFIFIVHTQKWNGRNGNDCLCVCVYSHALTFSTWFLLLVRFFFFIFLLCLNLEIRIFSEMGLSRARAVHSAQFLHIVVAFFQSGDIGFDSILIIIMNSFFSSLFAVKQLGSVSKAAFVRKLCSHAIRATIHWHTKENSNTTQLKMHSILCAYIALATTCIRIQQAPKCTIKR